jgi:hypothetical protein
MDCLTFSLENKVRCLKEVTTTIIAYGVFGWKRLALFYLFFCVHGSFCAR